MASTTCAALRTLTSISSGNRDQSRPATSLPLDAPPEDADSVTPAPGGETEQGSSPCSVSQTLRLSSVSAAESRACRLSRSPIYRDAVLVLRRRSRAGCHGPKRFVRYDLTKIFLRIKSSSAGPSRAVGFSLSLPETERYQIQKRIGIDHRFPHGSSIFCFPFSFLVHNCLPFF